MGVATALLITLTVALPAVVTAQSRNVSEQELGVLWQLLEYRDSDGDMQPVPPGIGVTFLPFAGVIKGEAACSSYKTTFDLSGPSIFIDPPEIARRDCDPSDQAVDDAFYSALDNAASLAIAGSILTVRDEVEKPLLTLTRASIPADPTIARWELARIGSADGSIASVIQGVEPWLEFLRGGRVVGSSGCGSFWGSYATNDSTVRLTDIRYRIGDCTEALQQQAVDIVETLPDITDFQVLPAGLTLEDSAGTIRLALVPDIDLGNRTWTPIEILDASGEIMPVSARLNTSAVRFAGGKADGTSYCRGFEGRSLVSGLALSTSNLKALKGACSKRKPANDGESPREIENAFLEALRQSSSLALRGSELELFNVAGDPVIRLIPQAELVGPTWVVDWMDATPRQAKTTRRGPKGDTPITATFLPIDAVVGDTGATDASGSNGYDANYSKPGAAQILITDVNISGRSCSGAKARTPLCRQEQAFKFLLESADRFIVRSADLRLFKGTKPLIGFVAETAETVN
jgi:heat shock protein HslJ